MYKVGKNRKCTKWPQSEREHLTVKSTPYTLNTYSCGPNFGPFALHLAVTEMHVQSGRKSEMHRMTPNWTWTPKSQKYCKYTKYLPWGPNFGPFRSTGSRFNIYKVGENRKCTEWPQTELEHLTLKNHSIYTEYLNVRP